MFGMCLFLLILVKGSFQSLHRSFAKVVDGPMDKRVKDSTPAFEVDVSLPVDNCSATVGWINLEGDRING
eukprot:m.278255 g.278255  ORF g.278255 m.278255 type:complete len:70 (-) comp93326_c0_seq1:297-506(-)